MTEFLWRLMIVEDEPAHIEAIRRALAEVHPPVEIQVTATLQEYRTMVAAQPPDLTLMDLNLPDGKATEVLTFPPEAGPFPILIMTSYGSEQIAVKALKAGALDYVVKSPEAFEAMPHILERARREWNLLQERQRAREALRENQLRLQFALDAAEAGVWIYNIRTGEIYWDDRMHTIFGLEPGSFAGTLEAWLARICPEDQAAALQATLKTLEQEEPYNFEYRVWGPNQQPRLVQVQALLIQDETGQPAKLAGICRDITARRQMEQCLRESEEKYRLLFENAPLGIMHYNSEGLITDCNEKCTEILGTARQKIFGLNLTRQQTDASLQQAARTALAGQPGYYEGTYLAEQTGKATAVRAFFQPVWSAVGQVVGGVSIIEDVSAMKRAAAEKQKLEAQLLQAQKLEAVGTLAAGIAHDFNNILAAIMGYTELATYSLHDAGQVDKFLGEVLAASRRAKNLVEQILIFGQKLASEKKPVSPGQIIDEAMQILRPDIPDNIMIFRHFSSHSPILADAAQVRQVIMNLVTNACQAMEESGGALDISLADVHLENPLPASQGTLKPGSYVRLQVKDTGSGIAPDVLPRIFEPYFSTKKTGQGNGLGLAAVMGLTRIHGGDIIVDSLPGQGTIFTIYLPQLNEIKPAATFMPLRNVAEAKGRILIVDDEPALVDLWTEVLNSLGYETTGITNSLEAREMFSTRPDDFDLLITDLVMPELNGLELARQVRSIRPEIPIIACTGYSERFEAEEITALGISQLFKKPLEVRRLTEVVQQILKAPAAEAGM